jgi:hypothetical protein
VGVRAGGVEEGNSEKVAMNAKRPQLFETIYVLSLIALAIFIGWKLGNISNYYSAERIAFYSRRDGNLEVYVMMADGSKQTRLTIRVLC